MTGRLLTGEDPVFAVEPWFGKQRLADYFDCSVRSIELAIADGMPHAIIFGRAKARPSEVEAWLEAGGRLERRGTLNADTERPGGADNAPGPTPKG